MPRPSLHEIQNEVDRRSRESIRIYRPYGDQIQVHTSEANELVVRGGKRCIPGDTLIYDPVGMIYKRVDEIRETFHVYSRNPSSGALVVAEAGVPFQKGIDDFYRVELSNGMSFTATGEHLVLSSCGWLTVSRLSDMLRQSLPCRLVSSLGTSLQAFSRDVGRSSETIQIKIGGEHLLANQIVQVGSGVVWDFEVESTGNYCLAGVVHHNSGKTVSVSQEIGSRITGIPVLDSDGNPIPPRWPVPTPDYPRTYWFIGYDLSHIGQTIHRIMFQNGMGGQFRCIKDEATGLWRAWNRADPSDVKRIKESRLTEPTIPPRMIIEDSWEWENKRGNHFKSLVLTNGARIFAFPSTGIQPKQGDSVSGIWIDEDIAYPDHLKEWQDRLTDENGWFVWSVWPHMKNPALLGLIERAELATLQEKPKIQSVQLIMSQNPYIPQEGKEAALGRMSSEEEIARRDRGDLSMDSYSMYSFDAKIHCIKRKAEIAAFEPERSRVYELIRRIYERLGNVPSDWTRYLVIDPSHTRTGVQSWCVPPQILEDMFIGNLMLCEWELVCKRMTAEDIARSIANSAGTSQYEAFIIDNRAGRQTHAGRDSNTRTFFSMAFRQAGLASRLTNADFIPGCDVPPTRYRAVRNLMEVVPGVGVPSLMLIDERCPQTKKEFTKYLKKRISTGTDSDSVMDEPANPRLYDLMACTEYAAAHLERLFIQGSAYVEPTVYKGKGSYAYRKAMSLKNSAQSDDGVVMLGVG